MGRYGTAFLVAVAVLLASTPALDDTIHINEWYYCGPFSLGARESVIGADPDIEIDPAYTPDMDRKYSSLLVPGGMVAWQEIASEHDLVEINYDTLPWDTLQDYYGVAGVSCGTYAYGEFTSATRVRGLVSVQGVSSFRLNGCIHPADPYGDGYLRVPVVFDTGVNRILLKLSGYGSHRFFFLILPARTALDVADDIIAPDIVRGDTSRLLLGVPVQNMTDAWIDDIRIQITGPIIEDTVLDLPALAPLCAMKVPVAFRLQRADISGDSVQIVLKVTFGDSHIDTVLWVQVKDGHEAHVRTFLSGIDNSCQYYAVLPPVGYREDTSYALIMTCHGAGVKAENQINAYTPKEWAFVVAPTNRRRYGFDWQDWGRLDFIEVLEDVAMRFRIDADRVYLTGHSMGGHGVWHIATMHPELFAAIAPSAGWTTFRLYIPWFLQKSEIFTPPQLLRFRDMALRLDDPLVHLERLEGVPAYILHGGADDNVPPIQGRMFAKYLDMLGYEYVYHEVPDKGHWWDFDSTPGVDCVDLKEVMDFLQAHVRGAQTNKSRHKPYYWEHSIKQAYFTPFVLVYGTAGDSLSTTRNFQQARYQAYAWWYRANGFCRILPDTAITPDMIDTHNLILFGSPKTNFLVARINDKLPVRMEGDRIIAGKNAVSGHDLCLVVVYPNPLNRERFVCLFSPASHDAERVIGAFFPLYSGAGLPDFLVYDRSVLTYSWAGVIAAGFFTEKWKYDPGCSYLSE